MKKYISFYSEYLNPFVIIGLAVYTYRNDTLLSIVFTYLALILVLSFITIYNLRRCIKKYAADKVFENLNDILLHKDFFYQLFGGYLRTLLIDTKDFLPDNFTLEERLIYLLDQALLNENYEKATEIRDAILKFKQRAKSV